MSQSNAGLSYVRMHVQRLHTALFVGSLLAISLLSLATGAFPIPLAELLGVVTGVFQGKAEETISANVVWHIRFPRIVLAGLVGAVLSVSGAALQSLLRNPLAEAGLLGISSGAALMAALMISLVHIAPGAWSTGAHTFSVISLAAFCGSLITCLFVFGLARRAGFLSVASLLLAGIAVAAIAESVIALIIALSDDQKLRDITFWRLGSLGGATWPKIAAVAPFIVVSLFGIRRYARQLNALMLGEASAHHLGVNTEKVKRNLVLFVALGVGAAVSLSGVIGFVGLIVPQLVRMLLGSDNRVVITASMYMGAILLIGSDWLARTIVAPIELPIGVVTALIGAPFFLLILVQQKQKWT